MKNPALKKKAGAIKTGIDFQVGFFSDGTTALLFFGQACA